MQVLACSRVNRDQIRFKHLEHQVVLNLPRRRAAHHPLVSSPRARARPRPPWPCLVPLHLLSSSGMATRTLFLRAPCAWSLHHMGFGSRGRTVCARMCLSVPENVLGLSLSPRSRLRPISNTAETASTSTLLSAGPRHCPRPALWLFLTTTTHLHLRYLRELYICAPLKRQHPPPLPPTT